MIRGDDEKEDYYKKTRIWSTLVFCYTTNHVRGCGDAALLRYKLAIDSIFRNSSRISVYQLDSRVGSKHPFLSLSFIRHVAVPSSLLHRIIKPINYKSSCISTHIFN